MTYPKSGFGSISAAGSTTPGDAGGGEAQSDMDSASGEGGGELGAGDGGAGGAEAALTAPPMRAPARVSAPLSPPGSIFLSDHRTSDVTTSCTCSVFYDC